jgi:hypothetical protein
MALSFFDAMTNRLQPVSVEDSRAPSANYLFQVDESATDVLPLQHDDPPTEPPADDVKQEQQCNTTNTHLLEHTEAADPECRPVLLVAA